LRCDANENEWLLRDHGNQKTTPDANGSAAGNLSFAFQKLFAAVASVSA